MNTEEQTLNDKLYDSKEAAAYLKLSPRYGFLTLERYAREGLITAGRVGRCWRFRKQDLDLMMFPKKKS